MGNQLLISILFTIHMNLVPSNGIVLCKVYRVRPAAICLLFSIVPYQVVLSVHFAPYWQIHLVVRLSILHCNLHGSEVRGDLRRYRRCFHIYDFCHLNSRMTRHTKGIRIACASIRMNLVNSSRIVFCQIHRVLPRTIRLLYCIIPNQIVLSIFFAPYRKFHLCMSMTCHICHLHRQYRTILHSRYSMISASPTGLVYRSTAIITMSNLYFRAYAVIRACDIARKFMGHILYDVNSGPSNNIYPIIRMNLIPP